MDDLAYASALEQAAALRERRLSARELCEQAIRRIEHLDGAVNAVVVRDFDRARAAAEAADAALASGKGGPLAGVPMTVKESFNVAGLPTTWGFPAGKNWIADEDAVAVQRLKRSGAVILGKTNVPLALGDWQSSNAIYGTTGNPFDLGRSPGGSSGGAAAALAAGYVALELGSDIGGSLRVPAHFCGVFAHKPSPGLLPLRGHVPPGAPALPVAVDLAAIGPMARTATDLIAAFDLLAGPDDVEATAWRLELPPPRANGLGGFRILLLDSHPLLPSSASVRDALDRIGTGLSAAGARVLRASPLLPDLKLAARIYVQLLLSVFGADLPLDAYKAASAAAAAIPSDADTLDTARARGLAISHRDWIAADRIRTGLAARFRALFKEVDVVLTPVTPTPAFPHDHSPDQRSRVITIDNENWPYADQVVWPGLATLCGLPATAVPIGRSSEGLPIGMQVIGPCLEDRTPLALAALIEQSFGGFQPPPAYA